MKYNTKLNICIGKHVNSKSWTNKTVSWFDLVEKCKSTIYTKETVSEYQSMSKAERSKAKDVGGFIGGRLKHDGQRTKDNIAARQVITLDADEATLNLWDDFTMSYDCAALIYSTHSHTNENPRFRLIIPLKREVSPLIYEAIARKIADTLGINQFDKSTFEPSRLMFWASTPKDGEFYFKLQDGEILDPSEILKEYKDNPENPLSWARHDDVKESEILAGHEKAPDPNTKPGIIGLFCRAYNINQAIEELLPDVYEPTNDPNRYTYKLGSSAGGLRTFADGYAESYHATDPANIGGHVINAFDLVRIHKFGKLDKGVKPDTPVNKLPSYIAMSDFMQTNDTCKKLQAKEQADKAKLDFADVDLSNEDTPEEDTPKWYVELDRDRKGKILDNDNNRVSIILNDPKFKCIRYDMFSGTDTIADPKSMFINPENDLVGDISLSRIAGYIENTYGIKASKKSVKEKYLERTANERGFNPVKDFIQAQPWDGTNRLETVLINYLGAADTELNRAFTKKWFVAAVARIYKPGTKFDNVLTLQGREGIGKSLFFSTIAGKWYNDSFSFAWSEKSRYEAVGKSWIIEASELNGMDKATVENAKSFISSQVDRYRKAYAQTVEEIPRHCVFAATTNEDYFLKSTTGDRRWWVMHVDGVNMDRNVWKSKLESDVPQIWAEAYQYYKNGEDLFLSDELTKQASIIQNDYNIIRGDSKLGELEVYLNTLLPTDWDLRSLNDRRSYFRNQDPLEAVGTIKRTKVCAAEIKNEFLRQSDEKFYSSQKINKMMEQIQGWKRSDGFLEFGKYGKQRGFIRTLEDSNDDEDI